MASYFKQLFNKLYDERSDTYLAAFSKQWITSLLLLLVFLCVYFMLRLNSIPASDEFLQSQRLLARIFLIALLSRFLLVVISRRSKIIPFIKDYFIQPGSAYTLAFFRIIFFSFLVYSLNKCYELNAFYASFPDDARVSQDCSQELLSSLR